MDLGSSY